LTFIKKIDKIKYSKKTDGVTAVGLFLNQVPEDIRQHIRDLSGSSGLGSNEASVEKMAQSWLEKMRCFEEKIKEQDMEEIVYFEKKEGRGALILTYSGSLLNLGPLSDGIRQIEYSGIGIRTDVPEAAVRGESKLACDISVGAEAVFEAGPVKKTSTVHKIAVLRENKSIEEQMEALNNTRDSLSGDFIKINKKIIAGNDRK